MPVSEASSKPGCQKGSGKKSMSAIASIAFYGSTTSNSSFRPVSEMPQIGTVVYNPID